MSSVLTVSQVNTYIKAIFEEDINLKNIFISGEISNFTNHYRTGHFYFTLKDERASIKAVMFKYAAEKIRFQIENGMKVIVRANVSVFERDGVYQLYVQDIAPDGLGALNLAFEQLKNKLASLGMFDENHKKSLPQFPRRIGVITSPTGAAIRDIISVLSRRYPYAEVILDPVEVQGDNAAKQISNAIAKFNALKAADVLIVGRGGGSIEDLWAFNEEIVAYAIFDSDIPIISAVGHETDFTIADFVSDLRAPTPSAAAEIAVPNTLDILYTIDKHLDRITETVQSLVEQYQLKLVNFKRMLDAYSPQKKLEVYLNNVMYYQTRIKELVYRRIEQYETLLSSQSIKIDFSSPLKQLARGYAIIENESGSAVTSINQVTSGEIINVRLKDGNTKAKIL